MATVHATVYLSGIMSDVVADAQRNSEQIDFNATEANVRTLLQEAIAVEAGLDLEQVDVDVSYDDGSDRISVDPNHDDAAAIESAARNAIVDFPWWDGNHWLIGA